MIQLDSMLDKASAYHQMRFYIENKLKTASKTLYSYFEYQVILFGLPNVSANFYDYVNQILIKKQDIFMIIYLYDILIYITEMNYINSV